MLATYIGKYYIVFQFPPMKCNVVWGRADSHSGRRENFLIQCYISPVRMTPPCPNCSQTGMQSSEENKAGRSETKNRTEIFNVP